MAKWMFDKNGAPMLILDGEKLRNRSGQVIGWINGQNVHSLGGSHLGWFEQGVIYDRHNLVLIFASDHKGLTPATPGLHGTPGMPGFSGSPGKPGFCGAPGRPANTGWSTADPVAYFDR